MKLSEFEANASQSGRTQWWDAGIKPAREGIYEVRVPTLDHRAFARWTGQFWCNWAPSAHLAQRCEWRGLRDGYAWRVMPS